MATRKKAVTAEELAQSLAGDAAYQARLAARREQARSLAHACAVDERELVADLAKAGVSVTSVWDFIAMDGVPVEAVSVLVSHLQRPHHPRVWEGIVRSLSVKHAREAALGALSAAYRSESDPGRRWVLANAIGSMARLAEVRDLPNIDAYRALFRQSRKPAHRDPAV